ncbi:hypothetical protein ALC62_12627, partial [Cyphomyrmex costatus]
IEEREKKWREEEEDMEKRMNQLEKKMEEHEVVMKKREEGREPDGGGEKDKESWAREEDRMGKIEKKIEMREREERRKNIIIKGLEGKTSDVHVEAERVLREILQLKVGIEEVKEVGSRREGGRRMAVVKLCSKEAKREVMMKKNKLKGRIERIEDDWTWKERKMQFNLRRIAEEMEKCGKRTRVAYGRIWIDGRWRRWNEDGERLEGAGRHGEGGEDWKIVFWNVAGMIGKDEEFWEGLKEWDIIGLVETWVEQKSWSKIRGKLPKEFMWKCQTARRKNRKGRAIGGIITGVRKGIEEVKDNENVSELEGMVQRKGRYWEDEERRVCRVCGAEEETWDHVLKRCAKWKEDEKEMSMEDILDEGGGGDERIRGLIGIREKMSVEEGGGEKGTCI